FVRVAQPKQALDPPLQFRTRNSIGAAENAEVLQHGEITVKSKALRNVAELRPNMLSIFPNIRACDCCNSSGRMSQAAQHSNRGRFSRTIRPYKTKDRSGRDSE